MNQIPNIEKTYNTREVEEVVKEFYKIFDTDNLWQGEDEWTKNVPIGNIEQWLRTTLHHQLQKAREETIHRILAIVSSKQNQFTSTYERGYQDCVKNILESIHHYQSKLDKPN